ncbi:MAG: hypothetical protein CMK56_04800 [Proteobacteria bacterium]|nr:hypothetical protein [Pseudomonadota bacterium]
MFEKLFGRFLKKKGKEAQESQKIAQGSRSVEKTSETEVPTQKEDALELSGGISKFDQNAPLDDKPPSGLINMDAGLDNEAEKIKEANKNGNGKPRVDVIDAMGNSVSEMVAKITKQLEASSDQLSRSRKYTNFAMILLGVTLLGTIAAMGSVAWTLSSQMGNVDEAISSLRSQADVQDNSVDQIAEMRIELQQLVQGQTKGSEELDAYSALDREIEIKIQELAVLIDKIAVNQTNIEGQLSSLSRRLTDGITTKGGANSEAMEKAIAKVEQRVGDLYTIEKARIAREIADLRARRGNQ